MIHPPRFNISPEKWMVGRLVSFPSRTGEFFQVQTVSFREFFPSGELRYPLEGSRDIQSAYQVVK